ncbi:MAG: DUF4139 domain-containing protein [Treponema sp.]|jgi:hypothetical protein|nr:DUF4139 domain-containing protein [Treponema sp.]
MKKRIARILCVLALPFSLSAQAAGDIPGENAGLLPELNAGGLPLRKIALFSSGLAYHEHSGTVNGEAGFILPFRYGAVNDALKSLVINDPASSNPRVSYPSEQALVRALRSLRIDLSGNPDTARILGSLRGTEVEIAAPDPLDGRIVGLEYRASAAEYAVEEPWLSLYTPDGLKLFNLKEVLSIKFKDPAIHRDLERALDLVADSGISDFRNLALTLDGGGSRTVSLSYVIPSPVWKVSYRLDLGSRRGAADRGGGAAALFQGWAIVDNDGDTDWNNIELSLVSGRPASFIQNLYPPYYQARPVIPLAIAGTAAAESHDQAYSLAAPASPAPSAAKNSVMRQKAGDAERYEADAVTGGILETAAGAAAGDQFEFTIKKPVTLKRGMSAMLPLVEGSIEARGLLVFSGSNFRGGNAHPRLGAEITNTTGMKLPAGAVTVYEDGTYAGDALIEFWNENEKRLISFGEDLSVTGTVTDSGSRTVSSVTLGGGVMTINRSQVFLKTYTFKNSSSESRRLVVEHPKTAGAVLESPEAGGQTPSSYRFTVTLSPGRELILPIREERPLSERISLLQAGPETFLSYSGNREIPEQVRSALRRALELKRGADAARTGLDELSGRRDYLVSEQDRIRKNLEAAGSQTQQGQEYLRRLTSLDSELDRLGQDIDSARQSARAAQEAYEKYLAGLIL